jgi:hypothetical protein
MPVLVVKFHIRRLHSAEGSYEDVSSLIHSCLAFKYTRKQVNSQEVDG